MTDTPGEALLTFLADGLGAERLNGALERVFTITFDEYEGKVLEFLDEDSRGRFGTKEAWAAAQLQAATLIEAVLTRRRET